MARAIKFGSDIHLKEKRSKEKMSTPSSINNVDLLFKFLDLVVLYQVLKFSPVSQELQMLEL